MRGRFPAGLEQPGEAQAGSILKVIADSSWPVTKPLRYAGWASRDQGQGASCSLPASRVSLPVISSLNTESAGLELRRVEGRPREHFRRSPGQLWFLPFPGLLFSSFSSVFDYVGEPYDPSNNVPGLASLGFPRFVLGGGSY